MMPFYRIAGLSVSSAVPLPGARAIGDVEVPDVIMRQAGVPTHLAKASVTMPAWEIGGDEFLFRAPGTARFLLTGGRDVAFEPEVGADSADCAVYLLGTVFGMLLHQRGQIVLHASAVAVDGKAILFCGRSGLGKSTLAAALSVRGYPLISDDICAIAFDSQGYPRVSADSRQIKLSSEAIDALGIAGRRGAAVLSRTQKYYVDPPHCAEAGEFPVAAIYALRRSQSDMPAAIDAPAAADALRLIQRDAYRPGIVKRTGQAQRYFEAAAAIARNARVFRLTLPRDLARLPETVALIERHWVKNGLLR
ncbi:MAG: hypothetical protein WAM62_12175 [Pseudolabrys sp.]